MLRIVCNCIVTVIVIAIVCNCIVTVTDCTELIVVL